LLKLKNDIMDTIDSGKVTILAALELSAGPPLLKAGRVGMEDRMMVWQSIPDI